MRVFHTSARSTHLNAAVRREEMEPFCKRLKMSDDAGIRGNAGESPEKASTTTLRTLNQSVSPPLRRCFKTPVSEHGNKKPIVQTPVEESDKAARDKTLRDTTFNPKVGNSRIFTSPFQLTRVRDLPDTQNVDSVGLKDILRDPLIAECWNFNYLHDIDFLLDALDEDVRDSVQIHLVHGFWKHGDPNRLRLQEEAANHKNVTLHCAFMPEMFGTHHSKMLVLIRHDDTARVAIHTANMIARDWRNMTQAVWQSPLLPLLQSRLIHATGCKAPTIGSGEKFKIDLLSYLRAYNRQRPVCDSLIEKLARYDFSSIRAALIASVPGRYNINDASEKTKWGWPALKHVLRGVPVQEGRSEIVVQVSSIATLGPTNGWLQRSLFGALKASQTNTLPSEPTFKVVFPTADEIRKSHDGYVSGASIHTKIASSQQLKQLQYLKPMFCHWANDAEGGRALEVGADIRHAGRQRAAPHIKTYIRYGEKSVDWALLTSANLSKQAWGEAANSSGEVRIASWEIGVLVWPSLYAEDATMVGTFQTDSPPRDADNEHPRVGVRIPYNLPLQRYGPDELPWIATANHLIPDWKGQLWQGSDIT